MTTPTISVIVPAFNAAPFIADCIRSVLEQDFPSKELIVVDDGSTDRTADVVQGFGSLVTYVWQSNSGACSAPRNTGVCASRGSYVTFLDADDIMSPSRLRDQIELMESHPSADVSVCNYRNFADDGPWQRTHFESCLLLASCLRSGDDAPPGRCVPGELAREILVSENFGSACGLMLRRRAFETLGGFDESLKASEDFDLLYRAAMRSPVVIMEAVGFLRRLHGQNMSFNHHNILSMKARSRQALSRAEPIPALSRALRDAARDYDLSVIDIHTDGGRWAESARAVTHPPSGGTGSVDVFVRAARLARGAIRRILRCELRRG